MRKMRSFLYAFAILLFIAGCQKQDSLPSGMRLLQKIVITSYDNSSVYYEYYTYDSQNRLVNIQHKNTLTTDINDTKIEYDDQGRLNRASYTIINHSNLQTKNIVFYSYVYDSYNKIVKEKASNEDYPDHTFGYDTKGRLIADTQIIRNKIEKYETFKYDINDNITERIYYDSNGVIESTGSRMFSYDNKVNPYSCLNIPVYFISGYEYHSSKNNTTEDFQVGNMPNVYINNYDSRGMLMKTIVYPSSNPNFTSTFEYFY